jgi:hypothetical protein
MVNKHMKKCSTFLAIKEMQIKSTLRFHLTPVIKKTNNIKHSREYGGKEHLTIADGNVNECSRNGNECGGSSEH